MSVTSNITWFHLNYYMVSRRIYKLSFYGEHSITNMVSRRIHKLPFYGEHSITVGSLGKIDFSKFKMPFTTGTMFL